MQLLLLTRRIFKKHPHLLAALLIGNDATAKTLLLRVTLQHVVLILAVLSAAAAAIMVHTTHADPAPGVAMGTAAAVIVIRVVAAAA